MSRLQIGISTLIFVGLALVGGAYFLDQASSLQDKANIAKLEYESGVVAILKAGLGQKLTVKKSAHIAKNESVETGADGFAVLSFESAYRVRILENSLVTLSLENTIPVVTVKRGDIRILNYGRAASLIISKNGQRQDAESFETSTDPDAAPVVNSGNERGASETSVETKNANSLTQEYIQGVLRTNKTNFYKCYTQLLQRTPGLTGQVNLSFMIENSGKVKAPSVVATNIQDQSFKLCLVDALSRIEFKSFEGEVISSSFPLKFE